MIKKEEYLLKDDLNIFLLDLKNYIGKLEKEMNFLKSIVSNQAEQIRMLNHKLNESESNTQKNTFTGLVNTKYLSSIGNDGVQALTQTFNYIAKTKQEYYERFKYITKQELLVFLTICQLEDDGVQVNYYEISKKLNLTNSCIRSYVSRLIRLGLPIIKIKKRNKSILLSLSKEFKELGLKEYLVNLYYDSDPSQKTLPKYYF